MIRINVYLRRVSKTLISGTFVIKNICHEMNLQKVNNYDLNSTEQRHFNKNETNQLERIKVKNF